jgi:hypothetical protein
MPQVDLTTLKESELRRLLGVTRESGQAAETYEILKEMAARREGGGGLFRARRPAEPRVIATAPDDADEASAPDIAQDEDDIPPLPPGWKPQAPPQQAAPPPKAKRPSPEKPVAAKSFAAKPAAAKPSDERPAATKPVIPKPVAATPTTPEPAPFPAFKPLPPPRPVRKPAKLRIAKPVAPPPESAPKAASEPSPLPQMRPLTSFRIVEPEPEPELKLKPGAPPPRPRAHSTWLARWSGPIFAGGVALGVTFGWWAGGVTRELLRANPQPAAFADDAPPPAPSEAAMNGGSGPAARPAAHQAKPAVPPKPATTTPSAADYVQDAVATETIPPDAAPAEVAAAAAKPTDKGSSPPVRIAVAPPRGCAAEPTPADRTICKTPHLQALQRELRRAYAEAMMVHEDRDLLRKHELEWRDARNEVDEPERLEQLYGERIRRLHAATAEARRVHHRG